MMNKRDISDYTLEDLVLPGSRPSPNAKEESAAMSKIDLAEIISIPIKEFLEMAAAPGRRNSEARAVSALHLKILVPEHLEVAIAEYPDPSATTGFRRVRMTGNTRAQVWKCGLSDAVPEYVMARLYRMKSESEVRERMLRHDSQEQAWSAADLMYRSYDMSFGTSWRPRSKVLRTGNKLTLPIRKADAIVHARYSPDPTVKIELVMKNWTSELMALDQLLDRPLAQQIKEKRPFNQGTLAGLLILLRYRRSSDLGPFIQKIMDDDGTKNEDGVDGVQFLIDGLGEKKVDELVRRMITAFDIWERQARVKSSKKSLDAIEWHQQQREAKRTAEKRALVDRDNVTEAAE